MKVRLFGFDIDNLTLEETLLRIDEIIKSGAPHQHVVLNAHKLALAWRDATLRNIINSCNIINVDGVPIIWASYLLGKPIKERVNGTDLMDRLVENAPQKGHRLYFLGGKEDVLNKLMHKYKNIYPGIKIVGFRNGYWDSKDEEEQVLNEIKAARPDILFVGFSSPKKEFFLRRYLSVMGVPFAMGVGGSFDAAAGVTKRAPRWMQRSGLEWFYRFTKEPKRMWRRYMVGNSIFIYLVLKEFVKMRILNRA